MRKLLFLIILSLGMSVHASQAQLVKATIGINGLTCSQCAKSVYNRLVKLKYIQKVEVDLNATEATVYFKQGMYVPYEALAGAVSKAGYSVRNMIFMLKVADPSMIEGGQQWCDIKQCVVFDETLNIDKPKTIQFQLLGSLFQEGGANRSSFSSLPKVGKQSYPAKLLSIE